MTPFEVMDCALLIRMSGLPLAMNLRELRDRIAICGENVLYHHFCETTLRPMFDDPDYRNDFAVWSKLYLGDRVLAEKLGILDPYSSEEWKSCGRPSWTSSTTVRRAIHRSLGQAGDEFRFKEATPWSSIPGSGSRTRRIFLGDPEDDQREHLLSLPGKPPPPPGRKGRLFGVAQERGEEFQPYVRRPWVRSTIQFHNLAHLREELARALLQVGEGK